MGTTIARLADWPRWPVPEGAPLEGQARQLLQDQVAATVLQAQEATTEHHTAVITCPVCRAPNLRDFGLHLLLKHNLFFCYHCTGFFGSLKERDKHLR